MPPSANRLLPASRLDYVLLLLLAAAWGSAFFLIKVAVVTIPPLSVAAGRLVIGAALLLLFARARGGRLPRSLRTWLMLAAMGAIGMVLPFTLIGWGETRIDSGLAAILISVVPFFTILLAHRFVPDEPLSPGKMIGVALGFLGVLVLIGPAALRGLGADLLAQLAIVGAAVCYAIVGVLIRRLRGLTPEIAAAGMLTAAAVVAMVAALLVDRPWSLAPTPGALTAVAALGLISTAGGYILFFRITARAGAGFASFNNYLVPVMGVLWGALLLGEQVEPRAFFALLLIFGGVAAPRLWPRRETKPAGA